MKKRGGFVVIISLVLVLPVLVQASIVETFDSGLGAWTATGPWSATTIGSNTVAEYTGTSSNGSQMLSRSLGATYSDSWKVSLDYDWRWGGFSNGGGNGALRFAVDVVNDEGDGYRLLMRQDGDVYIHQVNDNVVESNCLREIYLPDYCQCGWQSAGLSAPRWKTIGFNWDNGVLSVLEGTETKLSFANAAYDTFTTLRIVGVVTSDCGPLFDNVTAVPEPISLLLLAGSGLMMLRRRMV
jgi:hypothetical protein